MSNSGQGRANLEKETGSSVRYRADRIAHWNRIALAGRPSTGDYYHKRLIDIYRLHVPAGLSVLEIGCGKGELLAALEPSRGVGVDFSPEMIRQARERYPSISFVVADAHDLSLDEKFDVIILSDLLNDLWDLQRVLERASALCLPHTRIIFNFHNHLWEYMLKLAQRAGAMTPLLLQNWLTVKDVENLLTLSDLEVVRRSEEFLFPVPLWPLNIFADRYLVRFLPFRWFALSHLIIARPHQCRNTEAAKATVSVIVPARNEAGNIASIFARTPEMGGGTELVFVEGHSVDNTFEAIEQEIAAHPERNCRLLRQEGAGKGDAVRLGFTQAQGDILMILDADMTVPPEDLPRFYEAIASGKGEFINGVRLIYPMEKQAMRFLNLLGNKFFSFAFSWLLDQPVRDTLCGTKVLWKKDYNRIAANRQYFGDFDPFGDFDLLFGAAKLNLRHVEIPVRYHERTYGTTNIQRFRHGVLLMRMVMFAARKIKFV